MPIFDYQCEACGHSFDALQKVGEGPLRKCPECGKLKLKKQLAAPNFHLKGSGWYKTDFRDGPAKKAPESPASKSADKAVAKSDGDTTTKGHSLDTTPEKKHDHKHDHSHGGHSHSHGPGGHKH